MQPKNDDCPVRYGENGKCDSPSGKDNPKTTNPQYTHTCWWKEKYYSDAECPSGQKCYCGVCSETFTSEGCDENKYCNREYENRKEIGECVDEGDFEGETI